MGRKEENKGFVCEHCGCRVLPLSNGSYRNHCPECLYSKHVDDLPGDRANTCGGLMEPIGIQTNSNKGYQIIHRCKKCGEIKVNKLATNTIQSDNISLVIQLMLENVVK